MKFFLLMLISFYSTSMLFGAYDIKLGVFQNVKNLQANIVKVKPYTFRKQIIVKERKGFYYTYAIVSGSRSQANKALKAYQTIFKDAFISGQTKERPKVKKKLRKKKPVKQKVRIKKVKKIKAKPSRVSTNNSPQILDVKALLSNKTIYLCYEDGPVHLAYRVVQIIFNKDTISYSPLGQDTQLDITYSIEKNKILFSLLDIKMVHKVISNNDKYLSVVSYVNDKKMHTLRYYFNENLAFKYLKEN